MKSKIIFASLLWLLFVSANFVKKKKNTLCTIVQVALNNTIQNKIKNKNRELINADAVSENIIRSNGLFPDTCYLNYQGKKMAITDTSKNEMNKMPSVDYGYSFTLIRKNKKHYYIKYKYCPSWKVPELNGYWAEHLNIEICLDIKEESNAFRIVKEEFRDVRFDTTLKYDKWLKIRYNSPN